jgi:HSP20 family protein
MVELMAKPVARTANGIAPRRFDPFKLFDAFEAQLVPFWQHTYTPRTDVYEKDGMLVFKAELPGLTKEDVQVEVEGGDLVIKGEAKSETEAKDAAYYRMERTYGSFYRRWALPPEVKPEQITAMLTDGVLEVHVPKPMATAPETTKVPVA